MAEFFGYDVLLKIYNGSTYTTVAQVRDLEGPGLKLDTVEVTTHDTTSGANALPVSRTAARSHLRSL